jgi:GTP-binding protein
MSIRKAHDAGHASVGRWQGSLTFHIPSRGLIGYHGEFMTDTRGTGIMNRIFHSYQPWAGPIEGRRNGSLISNSDGEAVQYSLFSCRSVARCSSIRAPRSMSA